MQLIITLIALALTFRKIMTLKRKNDELVKKEKEVVAQMHMNEQFKVLAASMGGAIPMAMPLTTFDSEDPLGDLSKKYDWNHKLIMIMWILFFIIIALAAFKLLFPWMKLLGALGPAKFFHMLSL